MWIGLVSLCGLVTLLQSLGAEEPSPQRLAVDALCQAMPSRCPTGAAQPLADDLWTVDGHTLQHATSAPPEDPIASACRYVGFQTEWVVSKRDAGIPLGEALASYRRVFALDMPWQSAISGAMGTLVYRSPQR